MAMPESMLGGLGGLGGVRLPKSPRKPAANPHKNMASTGKMLYTRPTKSEVGYDRLGKNDTGGLDLEGRPLVARYVVGRTRERALEQSLPSEALTEIVQATTGKGIARVSAGEIPRGVSGVFRMDRFTGRPLGIDIRRDLTPPQADSVARHEVGHLLDELSGQIPTTGLSRELKPLYHYGVEGRERPNRHMLPQHMGYGKAEAPREYMAEALRQYMGAPDTMKAMAPKTAARIREYVNENPKLREIIQFNTIGGLAYGGLAGLGGVSGHE